MPVSSHGRVPRANIDPILTVQDAMAVFDLAISHPLAAETIVMFLDREFRGSCLVTVTETDDPIQVVAIAEAMALSASHEPDITGIVLATVRPGGTMLDDDDDVWFEASDVVESAGLTLIDWLIIGRGGTTSPRQQLGLNSRWPSGL